MARPSKYRPEYAGQVAKLCEHFGATTLEVAEFLGITRRTLTNWMHKHPELVEAMKPAKAVADERVVKSLYHRAIGYSVESEKLFCQNGKVIRAKIIEHYPPDVAAAIWWTKNRMPEAWRDRRDDLPGDDDDAPPPVKVEVQVVDGRRRKDA